MREWGSEIFVVEHLEAVVESEYARYARGYLFRHNGFGGKVEKHHHHGSERIAVGGHEDLVVKLESGDNLLLPTGTDTADGVFE